MRVRRANSDRVTSAAVAALSMAEMSSSSNQKEITRPMPAHIRWALVGISTFILAACATSEVKHEIVEVDGHTFMCSYTETFKGSHLDPQCVEVQP